jgi:8-oxo-dGTP diphosphatase
MSQTQPLHVAVGVIRDGDGRILLTQRAKHAHQGGLWEFPGGKREADETIFEALQRELHEEVGIEVQAAKPLIKIHHHYPDLQVLLDVWQVTHFSGLATACEGQAMCWVEPQQLHDFSFPAANRPIIAAAQLPDRYAILEGKSINEVLRNFNQIIEHKVSLLQLRIKSLPLTDIPAVYQSVYTTCQQRNILLLINSDLPIAGSAIADGLHLSSRALMAAKVRPSDQTWVAASCHNLEELKHAEIIGVDFVVLAPIFQTQTHPQTQALGMEKMTQLIEQINLPVFALGGLSLHDIESVNYAGGQGVAGISAFL